MAIISALQPLKPTAVGRKAVSSASFRTLCREIAAKVVVAGLPYEEIEKRLRVVAIDTLLPQGRSYGADEVVEFYTRNYDEIDKSWKSAIFSMMETIDADPAGTIARELGVDLPHPQR